MLPDRITGSDVAAACKSLGIALDGDFNLYDVKEVGSGRVSTRMFIAGLRSPMGMPLIGTKTGPVAGHSQ